MIITAKCKCGEIHKVFEFGDYTCHYCGHNLLLDQKINIKFVWGGKC
jgi:hypothetical protein